MNNKFKNGIFITTNHNKEGGLLLETKQGSTDMTAFGTVGCLQRGASFSVARGILVCRLLFVDICFVVVLFSKLDDSHLNRNRCAYASSYTHTTPSWAVHENALCTCMSYWLLFLVCIAEAVFSVPSGCRDIHHNYFLLRLLLWRCFCTFTFMSTITPMFSLTCRVAILRRVASFACF